MRKHKIYEWDSLKENIKDASSCKLLLGNGASIAVCNNFAYGSLYEKADEANRIDDNVKRLFEDFHTTDFEFVLGLLRETNRVNKILRIEDNRTARLYGVLQETLINTITKIHPVREIIRSSLLPISNFMKQFDTVLSLSYDLLVYWAMLEGNDYYKHGYWFKDCFVDENMFEEDFDYLYSPHGDAGGATLVFYPHGNLILAIDSQGNEIKLSKLKESFLITTITQKWKQQDCIPLFVSEGDTGEKLRTIRRSNYLDIVYHDVVGSKCDYLVIYGWAFKDDDDHILRALVDGEFEQIAVSVHLDGGNVEAYCDRVGYKLKNMHRNLHKKYRYKVQFFNSQSSGCWNNN